MEFMANKFISPSIVDTGDVKLPTLGVDARYG